MRSPSHLFKCGRPFLKSYTNRCFHSSSAYRKTCEPLRVLFCGSDDFSIASLRALNAERETKSATGIESIDVVCRPGKRTGRGLKNVRHPPIRAVAQDLELPLHEIDTFTRWQPPTGINLVVAVSFGLLVPSRILSAAKYGGLNVHPSMLPDLRGAAPLQHTLLQRRTSTGASVQTLHPSKFDQGAILAQTPFPGVPIPAAASPKELEQLLAPLGADLLVQTIKNRLFVEPLAPIGLSQEQLDQLTGGLGIAHASKITAEDRRIDWDTEPSNANIVLRSQVLGRLWDDTTYAKATATDIKKRITYGGWVQAEIESPSLEIQLGDRLVVTRPRSLEDGVKRQAHRVQISSEGTSADAASGTGTICATDFIIEGGLKNKGGQELARDMMRHREDLPWRST